jgi:transcriptional regulator with XRE-family HTH domain
MRSASCACTLFSVTRGQYLTKLRLAKGWKKRPPLVEALRNQGIEITAEAIRQYENDEAKPKPHVRAALAKVYGVSEEAVEFGREQATAAGGATGLHAREEILIELYRGLFPLQQADLLGRLRALFTANNITRKHLGNQPLVGVSDDRVEKAFGKAPFQRIRQAQRKAERDIGDAMGDFFGDE